MGEAFEKRRVMSRYQGQGQHYGGKSGFRHKKPFIPIVRSCVEKLCTILLVMN